ncbi:MAG: hypothetical protein V4502_07995 [Pseudomonadota bacterium]
MIFQMLANQSQRFNVKPVDASQADSPATLSNVVYSSADPVNLVATPDTDPANVNGVILAGQGNANVGIVVTAKATATEPDGKTTEVIVGSITIVLTPVAPPPPPPPAPAAALVFVPIGSPTP